MDFTNEQIEKMKQVFKKTLNEVKTNRKYAQIKRSFFLKKIIENKLDNFDTFIYEASLITKKQCKLPAAVRDAVKQLFNYMIEKIK